MADAFTLTELQRTVEAISGRHLHKQNFRRLVEGAALVEPTGQTAPQKGGGRRRCSGFAGRSSRSARHRGSASACGHEAECGGYLAGAGVAMTSLPSVSATKDSLD